MWIEGPAKVVLIGDGTHGTHEFYAHRANLTERLISEKGFSAVAIEADWPDAACANRCVPLSLKKKTRRNMDS
jgi:erythromycin esterase-like protein